MGRGPGRGRRCRRALGRGPHERIDAIETEAVFFDFDGVLAESAPIKTRAFSTLYRDCPGEVFARVMAYLQRNEGISRVDKIRDAHRTMLGIELAEDELDELVGRYRAMVEEAVVASDWVPGARAFLENHLGRLPMFVITGTPQDEIDRIVARRGMTRFFVSVHGSPPRKPPIVERLLADHGFAPRRVLFVGDATYDLETAREAGLRFVGRVPAGAENPFPDGTPIVADLSALTV